MSSQFGKWNFAGQPCDPNYMEKVGLTLAPYGPHGNGAYSKGGVDILYRAFHSTKDSHRETQPYISPSGAVITWDGRLDNRAELVPELRDSLCGWTADVAIIAAAYEKSGVSCFAKLIGDWALSIWNPRSRSLILAKDPIGPRHLYYSIDKDQVTWSSILDPLIGFAGKTLAISEEYIAGWLADLFPATHLTPYVGIHAVPPSSFVLLRPGIRIVSRYWDFESGKRIRYRTDTEYEDHFRAVFAKAVKCRLRSNLPVRAELSGGMDSSAIVCMADTVIAREGADTPRLDTISWFNDSDPDLDERPYFTKVEEKRGRLGCHIDLASLKDINPQEPIGAEAENDGFAATPFFSARQSPIFEQYATCMRSQGHRVTLSGIGGSEFLGDGVPTATLELQDLIARIRLFILAHQLNAWAAKMGRPRWLLLWEAVRGFFPLALAGRRDETRPASWLSSPFVHRNRATFRGCKSRVKLLGSLPSFQKNVANLEDTRRFLAYCGQRREPLREVRYPYLDRDLLEFLYAIPREQIVRVGQRRSLMKRALVGIVPNEILQRRRKASALPATTQDSQTIWPSLPELGEYTAGIVDWSRWLEASQKAMYAGEVPDLLLSRTLALGFWLRHISFHATLTDSIPTKTQQRLSSLGAKKLQAPPRIPQVQLASSWKSEEREGGENHGIQNSRTGRIDASDHCDSEQEGWHRP
jgi:asparagine synthase (glutamine-hydrolysing)